MVKYLLSKVLTIWIRLKYPKIPSQQRWFIRFRYLGQINQLKYFFKDYVIKKPYKKISFHGEFQQELLHVIPFAYWHYKNGTLLTTESTEYTKELYFFSPKHIENNKLIRDYNENENIDIPNAPHDTLLLKSKWMRVPYNTHYNNDYFTFQKEVLIVANRYNTEWGQDPISFFSLEHLQWIFENFQDKYCIIYNRPPASKISNDNSIVLDLDDENWIRKKFPDVVILSDLESNSNVNNYNHLQLLVYSQCKKFISVHGGTATLASQFGGINLIYSTQGHEHALDEFHNNFSQLSSCNVHSFRIIDKLFNYALQVF